MRWCTEYGGLSLFTTVALNLSYVFYCCFIFLCCKPSFYVSLLQVLLKLFSYCVKVKINRQQLVRPEMNTLNVMLGTLNLVGASVTVRMMLFSYLNLCKSSPSIVFCSGFTS